MAKTESTLDIRKKEWFAQNVQPPASYTRNRGGGTDKSSDNQHKSKSSGTRPNLSRRSNYRPPNKDPTTQRKNLNTGFTVHFSLARAIRAIRRQEKEYFRPTIPLQKIQIPAPKPKPKVTKRPPTVRKRKAVLKRFVFDHDSKQWKQEIIIDNQGSVTTHAVAVTDMASGFGSGLEMTPSFLPGVFSKPNFAYTGQHRSQTSLSGVSRSSSFLETRPPSVIDDDISTLGDASELVYFIRDSRRPDSTVSTSELSVTAESTDTDTTKSGQADSRLDDVLASLLEDQRDEVNEDAQGEENASTQEEVVVQKSKYDQLEGSDPLVEAITEGVSSVNVDEKVRELRDNGSTETDDAHSPPQPILPPVADRLTGQPSSPHAKTPSIASPQAEYKLVDIDTQESVGSMRFLTSQGSKVMVRRRSAKKKDPLPASESEDTEAEKDDFPGCNYLYRLSNCRAVTNPRNLTQRTDKIQGVGVIEVYSGHESSGHVATDRTCPYCVVEPERRISRWLSAMDSTTPGRLYSRRDALYYCKLDKKSISKRTRQPVTNLITIPEI